MRGDKIVAAAIRHAGFIWGGLRHGQIMQWIWEERGTEKIPQEEQGFLTNRGIFVNRYQAGAIAYMAGQTKTRKEHLLSEDLW